MNLLIQRVHHDKLIYVKENKKTANDRRYQKQNNRIVLIFPSSSCSGFFPKSLSPLGQLLASCLIQAIFFLAPNSAEFGRTIRRDRQITTTRH